MAESANKKQYKLYFPSLGLCTDNAAMIAGKAYHDYVNGNFAPLNTNAHPSLFSL